MRYATTPRSAGDNFHTGRAGHDIEGIVVHVTEGDRDSVRSWFGLNSSDVSAHYLICNDGTRDQFVEEDDTAFHAGRVSGATAKIVLDRPGVNPNRYLIGIEHEGTGRAELTARQRDSSLELIADIIARRPKVKATRYHIVGHHEIYAPKSCPGAISVDRLVAELAPSVPIVGIPPKPGIVWSDYFRDWLIVARVVSDTEWYFLPSTALGTVPMMRNNTALSAMKVAP